MSADRSQPMQIGTDDEQTVHRPPAPTVAEHNAAMAERLPITPNGDVR